MFRHHLIWASHTRSITVPYWYRMRPISQLLWRFWSGYKCRLNLWYSIAAPIAEAFYGCLSSLRTFQLFRFWTVGLLAARQKAWGNSRWPIGLSWRCSSMRVLLSVGVGRCGASAEHWRFSMDFLISINILIAAEGSYLMLIMIVFGEENHSLRNCPCLMCHRHNGFALRNLDLAFLFII